MSDLSAPCGLYALLQHKVLMLTLYTLFDINNVRLMLSKSLIIYVFVSTFHDPPSLPLLEVLISNGLQKRGGRRADRGNKNITPSQYHASNTLIWLIMEKFVSLVTLNFSCCVTVESWCKKSVSASLHQPILPTSCCHTVAHKKLQTFKKLA